MFYQAKSLKSTFLFVIIISFSCLNISIAQSLLSNKYNIKDFGAKGNDKTDNTTIINQTITDANQHGGGTVVIPNGIFVTSTIFLKSNVNIYLEKGAILKGNSNIENYKSFVPTSDLTKYSTISTEGNNSNSAYDTSWTKALIIGDNIQNVNIYGEGIIDGVHVYNSKGEEHMRGAHTIILANSRNITFSDIILQKAGNYCILGYSLNNITFQNIHIKEGWDGIHIRGGENILIRNSWFETGDDALAGGYWHNFTITDCKINSSCNGIRIIMPVDGVNIKNSNFIGPGTYAHRTSGAAHRTNMLAGIYIQPGGWGVTKGDIKNVVLNDLQLQNLDNPILFDLNKENNADNILIENIVGDSIRGAFYFHSHNGCIFNDLTLKNINIKFNSSAAVSEAWAFNANNIQKLQLENINWTNSKMTNQKMIKIENVAFPIFKNVKFNSKDTSSEVEMKNSGDVEY